MYIICFYLSLSWRTGLETSSIPANQHSLSIMNACETESPKIRKLFTPISSFMDSSKSNATNNLEDPSEKSNDTFHTTLPNNNTQLTTPSTIISAMEEENRTPRTHPSTPSTASVSMQMAMTPAPAAALPCNDKPTEDAEETEYSFEERRAGFVLSTTNSENTLQVL